MFVCVTLSCCLNQSCVIPEMSFFQNEENECKRLEQLDKQKVASQMAELKTAKLELKHEVDSHKKRLRLHMEAQVRTQNTTLHDSNSSAL